MLVSGTIGNSSFLNQDIQNTVASPTKVVAVAPSNTTDVVTATKSGSSSKQNQKASNNLGVEEAVREYFADIPLMAEVSKCESRYRQFNSDGTVFRGIVNDRDVGALQINETYHLKRASKLGYDVHTLQGNMAYARLLYQEQGPQPWSSSYPCWGKSPLAANYKPKSRTVIVSAAPVVASSSPITVSAADDAVVAKTTANAGTVIAAVTTPVATVAVEASAPALVNQTVSVLKGQ